MGKLVSVAFRVISLTMFQFLLLRVLLHFSCARMRSCGTRDAHQVAKPSSLPDVDEFYARAQARAPTPQLLLKRLSQETFLLDAANLRLAHVSPACPRGRL